MGIDLESIVSNAFTTVGSVVDGVVENIIYKAENAAPSYNATTGAVGETLGDIPIRAIRRKLTVKDTLAGGVYGIPGFQVRADDRIYLLPRADLGRLPKNNDKVVLSTGENCSVVAFNADPKISASLITIVLRKA